MISIEAIKDLLRTREDGTLFHRESQTLEFKESYNLRGLAEYFRDFAAFANNKGGYLIFGVKDRPKRELIGLSEKSRSQLDKTDPEKITGFLLEDFSGNITWEHQVIEIDGLSFGVFFIEEADTKPIICKKDEADTIKNGEIYFRYGGRTQKIQYPELEAIITHRVEKQNSQWIDLVTKIGKSGITQNTVWRIIDENKIKENPDYSCYNFRNKRQEEEYEQSGKVANGTPSIYKKTAIDYIIQIYNNEH